MKMFGNLSTDDLAESGDRLGGGGTVDTGVYSGTIKVAYTHPSKEGAQGVTTLIDINGREYRETFWIVKKNGDNFYVDKNDGKTKRPIPGWESIDELCLLTTGYGLKEQDLEEKVVNIYDFDQKRDVPTNVPVFVDLIGKPITAAIVKQIVDKQAKDTNGVYQNTGETREENFVEKFFHAESKRTVTEIKKGLETGEFIEKWTNMHAGKPPRDKAKGSQGKAGLPGQQKPAGGNSGLFGAQNQAAAATGGKKNLFGS